MVLVDKGLSLFINFFSVLVKSILVHWATIYALLHLVIREKTDLSRCIHFYLPCPVRRSAYLAAPPRLLRVDPRKPDVAAAAAVEAAAAMEHSSSARTSSQYNASLYSE